MISAYASANQMVLGQLKPVDKSNEITAIPELFQFRDLRGALATIDAMACQTKIAKTIVQQEGDYLLAVKGNQERLTKAVRAAFASHQQAAVDKTQWLTERHHDRVESRTCHVLSAEQLGVTFPVGTGLAASSWWKISGPKKANNRRWNIRITSAPKHYWPRKPARRSEHTGGLKLCIGTWTLALVKT
ncbi:MAG: ISAs1 family transposase, partial [Shewanella sp.]|nr:ISAs1 family transposase [Shewanella sp.]